MTKISRNILLSALALSLWTGGCASRTMSDPDEPDTRNGSVTIRVADDPEALANEMIHSWWVAFVSTKSGKVVKIESKDVTEPDGISQDLVSAEVPEGTYNVYGFANITPEEVQAATGLNFTVGSMPSAGGKEMEHAVILGLMWDLSKGTVPNLNEWKKDANIPMTGFLEGVKISRALNQDYAIEVVRMVAKMQFTFTSGAKTPVTVNSITLSPYTHESLTAFPDYNSLGNAPAFNQTHWDESLIHKPESDSGAFTVSAGLSADKGLGTWFYLRECFGPKPESADAGTVSLLDANPFTFTLDITKEGKTESEEVNFTVPGLTYVNRNDYIKIPVNFTDLTDLDVKVVPTFYPPIGGYPAMVVDEGYANPTTTVTFKSKGYFQLDPAILLDAASGEWITDRNLVKFKDYTITEAGPDGFMTLQVSGGEVVGRIFDITGQATVQFTILARLNAGTEAWQEYTRTLIIKRQQ